MQALEKIAASVCERLKSRKETISVAESSSGGLISASLLAIPGASSYFLGGSVVYTMAARKVFLSMHNQQLGSMKPLTPEYGLATASAVRQALGATWGISELGAAGPSGTRYGHEAGMTCIAVSGPIEKAKIITTGDNERFTNMLEFTAAALDLLEEVIQRSEGNEF